MLHFLPDFARSILAFLVVLGVLVFVHELGHYLAARLVRVHVEVFSIGFGRAIATWTDKVGTVWKLAWLPLGGYVKLHGLERPQDVSPEARAAWQTGRTFHDKGVGARAFVVAAGPIANFLLAMVMFALLFLAAGRPITLPVVSQVLADSPASRAGLQVNDRITAIDGSPTNNFEDIQAIVSVHPAQTLSVSIKRGDAALTLPVLTDARVVDGMRVGMLGIGGKVDYQKVGVAAALTGGVEQTWDVTRQTVIGVAQMLTGRRGTEDLGGPLRIAQLSGQVAELGVPSLISFIAVLSVNLGLINLFPIPVLDGGHLLFYLAEALRGRPLSQRAQEYGFRAGLALLAGLFVFATWNDLTHLGIFSWVAKLFG